MGPKVAAAAEFIRAGGRRAVITSLEKIDAAISDPSVGTQFTT
jgi:carbamate kinase